MEKLTVDEDEYPTEETLEYIEKTAHVDYKLLMQQIKEIWNFAEWGWHEEKTVDDIFGYPIIRYQISTAGWSGNESIIGALQRNWIVWHMIWVQSRRGGHYIFEVKE